MTIDELRESSRATVTVREAAELLGVDNRTLSAALSIHGGAIYAVRIGRRVVIPRVPLVAILDGDATRRDEVAAAASAPDATSVLRAKLIELLAGLFEGAA